MDAKELKIGMKIKLIAKRIDGVSRTYGYKCNGSFTIDSINDRMICLKKEGVGYKETIGMIDLRQGLYKMQLEDGTGIEFTPMVDVMKAERIKANRIISEYREEKRKENEVMEKITKERTKELRDSGMTIEQMADYFSESYPQMRRTMLKAKITMLLSDKKPGKPAKERKPTGRPKKQLPAGIISEIKGAEEATESLPGPAEQLPGSNLPPERTAEEIAEINSHEEYPETEEYPEIKEIAAEVGKVFDQVAAESMEKCKLAAAVDEMLEMVPDRDEINHPAHYTVGKIEVIDYLQDKLSPEMFEGFCIGNALKYLSRYRMKGGVSDLEKARWYLNRIIGEKKSA